jgi:hypothetical protein
MLDVFGERRANHGCFAKHDGPQTAHRGTRPNSFGHAPPTVLYAERRATEVGNSADFSAERARAKEALKSVGTDFSATEGTTPMPSCHPTIERTS